MYRHRERSIENPYQKRVCNPSIDPVKNRTSDVISSLESHLIVNIAEKFSIENIPFYTPTKTLKRLYFQYNNV